MLDCYITSVLIWHIVADEVNVMSGIRDGMLELIDAQAELEQGGGAVVRKRLTVELPEGLVADLDQMAEYLAMSRTAMMCMLLSQAVEEAVAAFHVKGVIWNTKEVKG